VTRLEMDQSHRLTEIMGGLIVAGWLMWALRH
jgi:hypothetical protein